MFAKIRETTPFVYLAFVILSLFPFRLQLHKSTSIKPQTIQDRSSVFETILQLHRHTDHELDEEQQCAERRPRGRLHYPVKPRYADKTYLASRVDPAKNREEAMRMLAEVLAERKEENEQGNLRSYING